MWWLYILKCADSTLYTGITTDIQRRISQHESGKGAKYCRGRAPLTLVYSKEYPNRGVASVAEREVKNLSREQKLELIAGRTVISV